MRFERKLELRISLPKVFNKEDIHTSCPNIVMKVTQTRVCYLLYTTINVINVTSVM